MASKEDQLEKFPTFEINGFSMQGDERKAKVLTDMYQKH
jgi:hypothetical protein